MNLVFYHLLGHMPYQLEEDGSSRSNYRALEIVYSSAQHLEVRAIRIVRRIRQALRSSLSTMRLELRRPPCCYNLRIAVGSEGLHVSRLSDKDRKWL